MVERRREEREKGERDGEQRDREQRVCVCVCVCVCTKQAYQLLLCTLCTSEGARLTVRQTHTSSETDTVREVCVTHVSALGQVSLQETDDGGDVPCVCPRGRSEGRERRQRRRDVRERKTSVRVTSVIKASVRVTSAIKASVRVYVTSVVPQSGRQQRRKDSLVGL